MKELISVIIPVYNAEAFIETCLNSLCCQSYETLEILVVDDGSKDNSFAVCEAVSRRDSRVVVLHQENQGVSAARNFGIENATGAYIAFVDADDHVKPDYFEVLYRDLKDHNADMACCDMIELLDGKQVHLSDPRVLASRLVSEPAELYRDMAEQKEAYGNTVWAKLIKAELAKKHSFPRDIKFGEDQIYMYKLFSEQPVVYLDTYAGYYYIRNDASATCRDVKKNFPRYMDEIETFRYKAANLPAYAKDQEAGFFQLYARSVCLAAAIIAANGSKQDWKKYYAVMRLRMREIPIRLLGLKTAAKMILLKHFPGIFGAAYRLKDKTRENG